MSSQINHLITEWTSDPPPILLRDVMLFKLIDVLVIVMAEVRFIVAIIIAISHAYIWPLLHTNALNLANIKGLGDSLERLDKLRVIL